MSGAKNKNFITAYWYGNGTCFGFLKYILRKPIKEKMQNSLIDHEFFLRLLVFVKL
jgi:hypothetical protein